MDQIKEHSVLDKLAARDAARLADQHKRSQERQHASAPAESAAAFLTSWRARHAALEANLEDCGQGQSSNDILSGLQTVSYELKGLQQELASAAYFLPAYDLRQASLSLEALQAAVDKAVADATPKQKFSFGSRSRGSRSGQQPGYRQEVAATTVCNKQTVQISEVADTTLSEDRGIQGARDQVLTRYASQLTGDFTLDDLQGCTVRLLGTLSALRMRRLQRCRIVCGPIAGPAFVDDVEDSTLMLASHQVRIHRTTQTRLYLRLRSNPIIEHCSAISVAPYDAHDYPGFEEAMAGCGLGVDVEQQGLWRQVHDFGWLRSTPSPNWQVMPEGERETGKDWIAQDGSEQ